jgi:hypothetical protein
MQSGECLKAKSRNTEGLSALYSYRVFHGTSGAIIEFGMGVTEGGLEQIADGM